MTAQSAKEVYALANVLFSDSHDLACFNLIVEVREGLLVLDDPAAAPSEGMRLAGIMGYVGFEEMLWVAQAIGGSEDVDDEADIALMDGMKRFVIDLPHLDEPPPPELGDSLATGLAALAAWRAPDGALTFVVYRHPDLERGHAYGMLKEITAALEAEMMGAPSGAASALPGN